MMNRNPNAGHCVHVRIPWLSPLFDTGGQGRLASIKPISDVVLLLLIF